MFAHVGRAMHYSVTPHWERMHRRCWMRDQLSEYFWNHATDAFRKDIDSRFTRTLLEDFNNRPYIGFHTRIADNMFHLEHDFGRNTEVTRSFGRFMEIESTIRRDNPSLKHVRVATCN